MPTVLTIAGSDPSGGAGIQSDLRTFNALGIVGLSAITSVTVQNSAGVQNVYPTPAHVLAEQLLCLFEDAYIDAVKIGMLGGAEQVHVAADILKLYRPRHVVLDPVMASTGGVPLLDQAGQEALLTELIPLCDLITPNLAEASLLTHHSVHDESRMLEAAQKLLSAGAKAVLVKGGHLPDEPIDLLVTHTNPSQPVMYRSERNATRHTHGTGCLLSSLIASNLAKDMLLEDAIAAAKATLAAALDNPVVIGHGRGYPSLIGVEYLTHTRRLERLQGVYVVTDSHLMPKRSAEQIVDAAAEGGAAVVQLREKSLATPELIALAKKLREKCASAGCLFIVNDRVDIALASNADGVHLGPDDMSPQDARRLLGPERLVGVSTGTLEEAKAAAPYASYFGVGAIFGTKTKGDAGDAIGLGRIGEIKAAFPHIPIAAIGGIHQSNISAVAQAGADAAAVVSAVVSAPDMAAAVQTLNKLFSENKLRV